MSEDEFVAAITPKPEEIPATGVRTAAGTGVKQICLIESRNVLTPAESAALEQFEAAGKLVIASDEGDWMKSIETGLRRSLEITSAPTVRAVVRDQNDRTIVHIYNLAIEKLNSFEDKVTPAKDITIRVRVPMAKIKSVKWMTADAGTTRGELVHTTDDSGVDTVVEIKIPKLDVAGVLLIE